MCRFRAWDPNFLVSGIAINSVFVFVVRFVFAGFGGPGVGLGGFPVGSRTKTGMFVRVG